MTIQILSGAAQLQLEVAGPSQVGECRRAAQRLAEANGFDATGTGRVGIIATELATNLMLHAGTGQLLLQTLGQGADVELELIAIDRGPGMSDVDRCLRDGYSTAGTAGNGLGAVSRLSTTFDMHSLPRKGTVVLSRVARTASPTAASVRNSEASLEFGAICVAMAGEIECGDTWSIARRAERIAMFVVDGLGHGPLAAAAAKVAADAFMAQPFDAPSEAMARLHRALVGTRGAAAACAVSEHALSNLAYGGVGNISGAMVSSDRSRGMVSHNGTLGVHLLRTQQFDYEWPPDSWVVMHSDGVSARWSLGSYPGLFQRHAAVIAAVLYRDHGRGRDDATVLVVGHRQ